MMLYEQDLDGALRWYLAGGAPTLDVVEPITCPCGGPLHHRGLCYQCFTPTGREQRAALFLSEGLPSLKTLRKRVDFEPHLGSYAPSCVTFYHLFPRVQIPCLEPRKCAPCGAMTWHVGPDKEMVCNDCETMYLNAWRNARVAHV